MSLSDRTILTDEDSTLVEGLELRASSASTARRSEDGSGQLAEMLRRSPGLRADRSFIIDKAVDEFLSRAAVDPTLTASDYCRDFEALSGPIKSSIYRQLEVEQFFRRQASAAGEESAVRELERGDRLGSFQVLEKLGQGALASVYLCTDEDVAHRQVIVKAGRAASLEAHTLGLLKHPNIVPIYSAPRHSPTEPAVLCMPFLGRSTLFDLIDVAYEQGVPDSGEAVFRAARLWERPSDEVADVAGQGPQRLRSSYCDCVTYIGERLADALAHAHEHGVVHGDVKPSNVLLSPQAEPLLVDFNLSGNAAYALPPRGGTLPYMPPEQVRMLVARESGDQAYDERSDIFSLGVLLYELLCGRLPFPIDGEKPNVAEMGAELLARQRAGSAPLRRQNGKVSPSLARTIERCLAWDPADRFPTAASLRDALLAEISLATRVRRRLAAHRGALLALVAAVLIGGAGWAAWSASQPPAAIQHFNKSWELRQADDLPGAETELRLAIAADPSFRRARFELGRIKLHQGHVDAARAEFFLLTKSGNDACSEAYVGYCRDRKNAPEMAIPWYERALASGCDAGEVHNNLAVAYATADRSHDAATRYAMAEAHLVEALARLPDSPTVKLNWVLHELKKAELLNASVSQRAVDFARQLTAQFPHDGYLHGRAARLMVIASRSRPKLIPEALNWLGSAISLGHGPGLLRLGEDPFWDPLRSSPHFVALLNEARVVQPAQRRERAIPRILEPISCASRYPALPRSSG
jgi:serine/threonine protein kinase